MSALVCQLGAVTLRLSSTSTPGVCDLQRYRGARPVGGISRVSLGEVCQEAGLRVIEGDLASFREAVAAGVADDPFAACEASV